MVFVLFSLSSGALFCKQRDKILIVRAAKTGSLFIMVSLRPIVNDLHNYYLISPDSVSLLSVKNVLLFSKAMPVSHSHSRISSNLIGRGTSGNSARGTSTTTTTVAEADHRPQLTLPTLHNSLQ